MTREETIVNLEKLIALFHTASEQSKMVDCSKIIETLEFAATALRPVSREKVERMRGEWVAKHRHRGGFRRVTGVDDIGEQRTITIDERREYDDLYCSKCGKQSPDNFLNFCGYCGAPMTDEAVKMVMERLEALWCE